MVRQMRHSACGAQPWPRVARDWGRVRLGATARSDKGHGRARRVSRHTNDMQPVRELGQGTLHVGRARAGSAGEWGSGAIPCVVAGARPGFKEESERGWSAGRAPQGGAMK